MNQVRLDPTQLSILSIPRKDAWIFDSPILRVIHRESKRTPQNGGDLDEEDFSDDSEYDSDGELTHSWSSSSSSSKRGSFSRKKSVSRVDNSAKDEPPAAANLSASLTHTNSGTADGDDSFDEEGSFFFHIAYTPLECTIICSAEICKRYFTEPLDFCRRAGLENVILIEEQYINLQIDSDGEVNNSLRILELTRPLSANGITLFFLSSHFTDIVLIPYKEKEQVIQILTKQNFEFSDVSNSYIVSQNQSFQEQESLLVGDIEASTLRLFKEHGITPKISKKSKLLLTGARPGEVSNSFTKTARCIGAGIVPDYFAITRTSSNEVSLILPGSARKREYLGFDFKSIIGSATDIILPITVDLTKLPIDSTGIVAGLASRIISNAGNSAFEMTYLSMARAGVVMIPEENLDKVTEIIRGIKEYNTEDIRSKLSSFSFE